MKSSAATRYWGSVVYVRNQGDNTRIKLYLL